MSYGYGGTGKVSVNNKFFDYGEPYTTGDIICCCIDLDATPRTILFTKNGNYLGVAFRLGPESNGQTFFPHITVKNMRLAINFGQFQPYFPPLQGFSLLSHMPPQYLERGSVGPLSRGECEIIMMVGLPGCGKTFWAEKYAKDHPEKKFHILGTNTVMDKMKVMGLMRKRNYHGRWDALIKQATDVLNKIFKIAERKNRNYILDQTNVYFTARRRKMNNFHGFRRIAAVIVNTNDVLKERTEKREREEGKVVPESAVLEMKANFALPEVGDTFDDVWYIEEDKASSEGLVAQFQREGKEFKENEKKRKPGEVSASSGNTSSDIKRQRPEQAGHTAPSYHSHRGQHSGHSDRTGFHGNYQSRDQRGASHDKPFYGNPPDARAAPIRPRNDHGPFQPPSGQTREPRRVYNQGPQPRYNDYSYGASYGPQENYDQSQPPSDNRYQSHYQPPMTGDNYQYYQASGGHRYQSNYQLTENRYGPPLSSQYNQYAAQSYQQGQDYYSGGVGRGPVPPGGQYGQYGYGGGY